MSKPNVVLILADDMGYGDLSCLNDESKIHTKHMDQMAADGMTFTDAHASTSVCTPSRYGILTGRYAWRGRLQRWVLWMFARPLIERDLLTLPQFLKNNGYDTACVGKWHLGMDWPYTEPQDTDALDYSDPEGVLKADAAIDYSQPIKNGPTSYGFDYYFGVDVPNFAPYCFIENDRTVGVPDRLKPDEMYGSPGSMVDGWDLEQIMPTLTEKAVGYIDEKANGDAPFFLYFSLTGPHTPIVPTKEFKGTSQAGDYGDFVTQLDDTVGQVNAALRRNGIEENTLVIITSDNGSPGRSGSLEAPGTVTETHGHNPSWILRGMKADTWDGGHRIPFICKWPERIAAGSVCDELVCIMDLMGTCAGALDVDLPSDVAVDSFNILPYLEGREVKNPVREDIVHHGGSGQFGIRSGDWKLIYGLESGGFSPSPKSDIYDPPGQLYNMKEDIRERHNLYNEHPEIVSRLTSRLEECRRASGTVPGRCGR